MAYVTSLSTAGQQSSTMLATFQLPFIWMLTWFVMFVIPLPNYIGKW